MRRYKKLTGMDKEALTIGKLVSGLVLTSEQDKQWLNARFEGMSNILEESWLYQEILQKGRQRGLLHFVELRFPSLLVLAKPVIERSMSLQQFEALEDKLYSALTIEDASAALQDV